MFVSKVLILWFAALIGFVLAAPVQVRDQTKSSRPELVARSPPHPNKPKLSLKHAINAVVIKNKIDKAFAPKRSESVFWSGTVPHDGGVVSVNDAAQKYAQDRNKKTLNHALHEANIMIPEAHENPHVEHLWNHASTLWAKKSHGEVDAVLGSHVRPGGVYKKIEKPILLKNDQVTRLTEYNAHTHKTKVAKPVRGCPGCVITK